MESVETIYPGHDRPFRLDGDQISYLEGPINIEIANSTEGLGETSLTFKVLDAGPATVQISQDLSQELAGGHHLQFHRRLQQN